MDVEFVVGAPGAFSAGVSNAGNTAGSTGVTGTRVVFVGGTNISLSQSTDANGATISVNAVSTAPQGAQLLWYANAMPVAFTQTNGLGITRPFFEPFVLPQSLSANTMLVWATVSHGTVANNSTQSAGFTLRAGVFQANSDSLSLLVSGSAAFTFTNTSNANLASASDLRFMSWSFSHTTAFTPGNYWMGIISDSESAGVGTIQASLVGFTQGAGTPRGPIFAASSNRYLFQPGLGRYTAASAQLPASPAFTQISGDASAIRSQVYFDLRGSQFGSWGT